MSDYYTAGYSGQVNPIKEPLLQCPISTDDPRAPLLGSHRDQPQPGVISHTPKHGDRVLASYGAAHSWPPGTAPAPSGSPGNQPSDCANRAPDGADVSLVDHIPVVMHDGVPFRQGAHSIDLPRYEGLYNRHQQDPNHVSRPQFNPPPHPPPINSWQYQPTYTQPNPPPNPQPIPPPNYQPNPIIHMQNPTAQPGYVVQQQPLGVIIVPQSPPDCSYTTYDWDCSQILRNQLCVSAIFLITFVFCLNLPLLPCAIVACIYSFKTADANRERKEEDAKRFHRFARTCNIILLVFTIAEFVIYSALFVAGIEAYNQIRANNNT